MVQPWSPELRLEETPRGCRLCLVGFVAGEGETLQAAATDLLARVTDLVVKQRASGFRPPVAIRSLDGRKLAFLWEVAELVARGEDIRERVLGLSAEPDPGCWPRRVF